MEVPQHQARVARRRAGRVKTPDLYHPHEAFGHPGAYDDTEVRRMLGERTEDFGRWLGLDPIMCDCGEMVVCEDLIPSFLAYRQGLSDRMKGTH